MAESGNKKAKKNDLKGFIKIFIIVIVIVGAIWTWNDYVKDRVIAKKFGVVVQGEIYRSGQISYAIIGRIIEKHNIKMIVDLTLPKTDDRDQDAERAAAEANGAEILRYPMGGNGIGTIDNYAGAVAAIDRAVKEGKPVLVHCAAGAQRTGGVIATYRLLVENAIRILSSKR